MRLIVRHMGTANWNHHPAPGLGTAHYVAVSTNYNGSVDEDVMKVRLANLLDIGACSHLPGINNIRPLDHWQHNHLIIVRILVE